MTDDDIKFNNGKYTCTIYLYPGITGIQRSALENFLFLKWYIESIGSYMERDFENNRYILKLVGPSLTNVLRARFEIVNYFVKDL